MDVHAPVSADDPAYPAAEVPPASSQRAWLPPLVAVVGFLAFCAVVLSREVAMLEPDDSSYRAALVALTQGHWLLTDEQYRALSAQLGQIMQWTQLPSGLWTTEKNPGYVLLAYPFQALGVLRLAPLFYGAIGCVGLYTGGRRWLGRWGGTWTVLAFLFSGAAIAFAWRPTMPTFTDAALVAAGTGGLLWALLATDRTARARVVGGSLAVLAFDLAVLARYTNIVVLVVAVVAVLATYRRAGLAFRHVAWWLGLVALLIAVMLGYGAVVYGSATGSGYGSGVITFSLAAIGPNLAGMPGLLLRAMPVMVVALAGLVWIGARYLRHGVDAADVAERTRDLVVGGFLAAGWFALWAVYAAYDWTAQMLGGGRPGGGFPGGGPGGGPGAGQGGSAVVVPASLPSAPADPGLPGDPGPGLPDGGLPGGGFPGGGPGSLGDAGIHVIRFYVPVIGLVALLAAFTLSRLPRWWLSAAVVVVLVVLAYLSADRLVATPALAGRGGFGVGPVTQGPIDQGPGG
ncbi:MAG: hypothetical protein U0R68_14435 [Candidatus Nanopelagicales bacterium]